MQAWTSMSSETFSSVGSGAAAEFLDAEDSAALLVVLVLGPVEVGTFMAELELLLPLLVLPLLLLLLLLLLFVLLPLLLLTLMLDAVVAMESAAQTSASMSSKSSSD
jgi:uncharacterized protein (DUF983 family)